MTSGQMKLIKKQVRQTVPGALRKTGVLQDAVADEEFQQEISTMSVYFSVHLKTKPGGTTRSTIRITWFTIIFLKELPTDSIAM